MDICSPSKSACVNEAVTKVEESAFEGSTTHGGGSINCNCLPACTDLEFPHESSVSSLTKDTLTYHLPDNYTEADVQDNLAVVHIYLKHLHFLRRERGQLYGVIDFFSNIGGLLGLCLGFSAVSAIEFFYFFTIRMFYNNSMNRKEQL